MSVNNAKKAPKNCKRENILNKNIIGRKEENLTFQKPSLNSSGLSLWHICHVYFHAKSNAPSDTTTHSTEILSIIGDHHGGQLQPSGRRAKKSLVSATISPRVDSVNTINGWSRIGLRHAQIEGKFGQKGIRCKGRSSSGYICTQLPLKQTFSSNVSSKRSMNTA